MNIFDIIAIVIFAITVISCTFKGFLKIVSRLGALFVAIILAKWFGGMVGESIFGDTIGEFAPAAGVAVLFVVLLILCRIIFGLLAKIITKILHTKTLDKILGALIGIIGGFSGVYFFAWVLQLVVALVSLINSDSSVIGLVDSTYILKFFM